MNAIEQHLQTVRARIRAAEQSYARAPGSVQLLAVSKLQAVEKIHAALHAGQRAFGESYLQEALEKIAALADLDIEWHYIGRIQSNKTRQIAENFSWVHSLCDLHHARRLSSQRPASLAPLQICIQVNISGERTKGGLAPQAVAAFVDQCADLPRLELRGLMVLPAPAREEADKRQPMRALRELRDRLASPGLPLATLSMGMSADMEAAIAEGATIVRIGTDVFGPRPQPKAPAGAV